MCVQYIIFFVYLSMYTSIVYAYSALYIWSAYIIYIQYIDTIIYRIIWEDCFSCLSNQIRPKGHFRILEMSKVHAFTVCSCQWPSNNPTCSTDLFVSGASPFEPKKWQKSRKTHNQTDVSWNVSLWILLLQRFVSFLTAQVLRGALLGASFRRGWCKIQILIRVFLEFSSILRFRKSRFVKCVANGHIGFLHPFHQTCVYILCFSGSLTMFVKSHVVF